MAKLISTDPLRPIDVKIDEPLDIVVPVEEKEDGLAKTESEPTMQSELSSESVPDLETKIARLRDILQKKVAKKSRDDQRFERNLNSFRIQPMAAAQRAATVTAVPDRVMQFHAARQTQLLSQLVRFNTDATLTLASKQLGYQIKQTLIQKDILAETINVKNIIDAKLDAIKVNTALPDIKKRGMADIMFEMVQRDFANAVLQKTAKSLKPHFFKLTTQVGKATAFNGKSFSERMEDVRSTTYDTYLEKKHFEEFEAAARDNEARRKAKARSNALHPNIVEEDELPSPEKDAPSVKKAAPRKRKAKKVESVEPTQVPEAAAAPVEDVAPAQETSVPKRRGRKAATPKTKTSPSPKGKKEAPVREKSLPERDEKRILQKAVTLIQIHQIEPTLTNIKLMAAAVKDREIRDNTGTEFGGTRDAINRWAVGNMDLDDTTLTDPALRGKTEMFHDTAIPPIIGAVKSGFNALADLLGYTAEKREAHVEYIKDKTEQARDTGLSYLAEKTEGLEQTKGGQWFSSILSKGRELAGKAKTFATSNDVGTVMSTVANSSVFKKTNKTEEGEDLVRRLLEGSPQLSEESARKIVYGSSWDKKTPFERGVELRDFVQDSLSETMPGLRNNITGLTSMAKDVFVDLYRADTSDPGQPLITKRDLEAGLYFVDDNTPVKDVEDIDRPVQDANGNVKISVDDLRVGLVNRDGKQVSKAIKDIYKASKTTLGNFINGAVSWGKKTLESEDVSNLKDRAAERFDSIKDSAVEMSNNVAETMRSVLSVSQEQMNAVLGSRSDATNEILTNIHTLLLERLPEQNGFADRDGDGTRDNSYADLAQQKMTQRERRQGKGKGLGVLGTLGSLFGGAGRKGDAAATTPPPKKEDEDSPIGDIGAAAIGTLLASSLGSLGKGAWGLTKLGARGIGGLARLGGVGLLAGARGAKNLITSPTTSTVAGALGRGSLKAAKMGGVGALKATTLGAKGAGYGLQAGGLLARGVGGGLTGLGNISRPLIGSLGSGALGALGSGISGLGHVSGMAGRGMVTAAGKVGSIGAKGAATAATGVLGSAGAAAAGAAATVAGKSVGTSLAKTAGKTLLKKIPLIGLAVGIGLGIDRLMDGDLTGAAGEVLSGLVGTIPGVGTAASLAIDGWLGYRDYKRSGNITNTDEGQGVYNNAIHARMVAYGIDNPSLYEYILSLEQDTINVIKGSLPKKSIKDIGTMTGDLGLNPNDNECVGYVLSWYNNRFTKCLMVYETLVAKKGVTFDKKEQLSLEETKEVTEQFNSEVSNFVGRYKKLKPTMASFQEYIKAKNADPETLKPNTTNKEYIDRVKKEEEVLRTRKLTEEEEKDRQKRNMTEEQYRGELITKNRDKNIRERQSQADGDLLKRQTNAMRQNALKGIAPPPPGTSNGDYSGRGNIDFNGAKTPVGKDEVLQIIADASKKVGVDHNLMATMANIESSFNPNAKAGTSSAGGLFQFIDGTWQDTVKKHGAKHGITLQTSKFDPVANSLMGAEFLKDNLAVIGKYKPNPTVVDAYLAHFMGVGGASKFTKAMMANPNAIVDHLGGVTDSVLRANRPIFAPAGQPVTYAQAYDIIAGRVKARATNIDKFAQGSSGSSLAVGPTPDISQVSAASGVSGTDTGSPSLQTAISVPSQNTSSSTSAALDGSSVSSGGSPSAGASPVTSVSTSTSSASAPVSTAQPITIPTASLSNDEYLAMMKKQTASLEQLNNGILTLNDSWKTALSNSGVFGEIAKNTGKTSQTSVMQQSITAASQTPKSSWNLDNKKDDARRVQ